jgi:hypothetical protein
MGVFNVNVRISRTTGRICSNESLKRMAEYNLRDVGAGDVQNGPAEEARWQNNRVDEDRQWLKT